MALSLSWAAVHAPAPSLQISLVLLSFLDMPFAHGSSLVEWELSHWEEEALWIQILFVVGAQDAGMQWPTAQSRSICSMKACIRAHESTK